MKPSEVAVWYWTIHCKSKRASQTLMHALLSKPVDFLLTAKRDRKAAMRFLKKAIKLCGTPKKVNIDKSGANTAGLNDYNMETRSNIKIRQSKYLNNLVEQDHRNIKRKTRPMLGFKSFYSAAKTLAGIELIAMIKKGQISMGQLRLKSEIFYALAA